MRATTVNSRNLDVAMNIRANTTNDQLIVSWIG